MELILEVDTSLVTNMIMLSSLAWFTDMQSSRKNIINFNKPSMKLPLKVNQPNLHCSSK